MSNKIALVSLDFAGTGSMCGSTKELPVMDAQLVEATIRAYLTEIRSRWPINEFQIPKEKWCCVGTIPGWRP